MKFLALTLASRCCGQKWLEQGRTAGKTRARESKYIYVAK